MSMTIEQAAAKGWDSIKEFEGGIEITRVQGIKAFHSHGFICMLTIASHPMDTAKEQFLAAASAIEHYPAALAFIKGLGTAEAEEFLRGIGEL